MLEFLVLVSTFILIFFLFSVIGWLMEVILKYMKYRRFINRGYLVGPYCPIYGCGAVAVTILVNILIGPDSSYGDIFLAGMVVCGVLEYFVGWLMETTYHARWWDYSDKPMNLHGRIWIGNLILFGFGSIVIIKFINPILFEWLDKWSDLAIIFTAVFIILLMITDNIVSGKMMNEVKHEIDASQADNTEEISRRIRELLKSKNILIRRINSAYPHLKARPAHLTEQWKKAKRELREASKEVKTELKFAADIQKEKARNASLMTASEIEYKIEQAKEKLEKAKEELRDIETRLK